MEIKDWVRAARKHRGLTLEQLGTVVGRSKANIGHWESGLHKPGFDQLRQIAEATGYDLALLTEDGRTVLIEMKALGAQGKPWGQSPPVAHQLSYQPFDHPLLTREQLMTMGEVPARFVFALEDDAMGEHGRAGTEVLFHKAGAAKVGAGVLVRDKAGGICVRRKAQGKSDSHWLAVAPNKMFRDLDSEADGLQILAVWRGVVNRGLEDF